MGSAAMTHWDARASFHGRASRMMLVGVSAARRTWVKPAWLSTSRRVASPAWAPSPASDRCLLA